MPLHGTTLPQANHLFRQQSAALSLVCVLQWGLLGLVFAGREVVLWPLLGVVMGRQEVVLWPLLGVVMGRQGGCSVASARVGNGQVGRLVCGLCWDRG